MNHQPDERLDAYLWDPAAPADPSVAEIERRLAPIRFDPAAHPLPAAVTRWAPRAASRRPLMFWLPRLAAAAALLVIVGAAFAAWKWTWPDGRAWQVVAGAGEVEQFAVGSTLRTDPSESSLVRVARIGTMRVAGDTAVSLQSTASNRHSLVLREGSVRVRVWAPPFSVTFRTPAGDVSDLGCEFDLTVDGESSRVRVTSGWVQLENILGETLVPAGASSVMVRGVRPSVPVFDDAPVGLLEAVRAHEAAPGDAAPVDRIVSLARPRDVFTLLHLVHRGSPAAGRLIERSAQLFPPPDGVEPARAAARDERALDRWRSSLPLPSPKRTWLWNWRDGFSLFGTSR